MQRKCIFRLQAHYRTSILQMEPAEGQSPTIAKSTLMRKSGSWMTIWDDRLLEIIREEGSGTPSELASHEYVRITKSSVSRRLRKLAEHKMLDHLGNGVYVITDKGIDYLEGRLDAEDIIDENGNGDEAEA